MIAIRRVAAAVRGAGSSAPSSSIPAAKTTRRIGPKCRSSSCWAEVEAFARAEGRTLLVLDTEKESVAESVYRRRGWQRAGEIPNYALTPSGKMHATVYYYKLLP